jgi:hypothetical protein
MSNSSLHSALSSTLDAHLSTLPPLLVVVGHGVGALVLVWWDTIDIVNAQLDAEGTTVLLFLFHLKTSVFFSAKAQWW